jgi:hypothetical protein
MCDMCRFIQGRKHYTETVMSAHQHDDDIPSSTFTPRRDNVVSNGTPSETQKPLSSLAIWVIYVVSRLKPLIMQRDHDIDAIWILHSHCHSTIRPCSLPDGIIDSIRARDNHRACRC